MISNSMSIRTLFLAEYTHPSDGGPAIRNYQNINIMMDFGPVSVLSFSHHDYSFELPKQVEIWQYADQHKHLLLSERFEHLLWLLRQRGRPTKRWPYRRKAARKLASILMKFKPHLVIFEQLSLYHYLPIVRKHKCNIILDEHNIEAYLFKDNWCSTQTIQSWIRLKDHFPQIRSIEEDFIHRVDQVWLCSHVDKNILQNWYGINTPSSVIPNGINLEYYNSIWTGDCKMPSELENGWPMLLFLGTLSYSPNTEAVKILIEQIYPALQEIYPDCRLFLVGRDPTSMMWDAAQNDSKITITGKISDIRPYLAAADVMVVPLQKGSGTRFKILEAFASGCPVVSTEKGVEGICAKDREHLIIENTILSITQGICNILDNPELKNKIIYNAYDLVKKEYSWKSVSSKAYEAIASMQ